MGGSWGTWRGRQGLCAVAWLAAGCAAATTPAPESARAPRPPRTELAEPVADPIGAQTDAPASRANSGGKATDPALAAQVTEPEPAAPNAAVSPPEVNAVSAKPAQTAQAAAVTPAGTSWASLTRGTRDEADRLLALGDAAFEREQYEVALGYYRQARRLIPQHPGPVVGIIQARAGILHLPKEFAAARRDAPLMELQKLLDGALELDPRYVPALLQAGQLWLIVGEAERARDYLDRALADSRGNPEVYSARAVAAMALGDKDGALRGFQKAAELEPSSAARMANLGTALLIHGDVQQAITALQRAAALDPNDPRAQGDLGTALLATGNVRGALTHLNRAHELAPQRATFMSNLGYAHQQLGDVPKAMDWYNRALESDPKLGSAWVNLGIAYAELGDKKRAEAAFRKALAIDASDPRALGNLQDLKAKP